MPPLVRSLVRSAFTPPSAGPDDRTDAALLALFVGQQDAAAFELLVRRHGPMVRAVCRGVLRNPADADDAFQATFLVLVRRAEAIRDRAAVGAWLYGVAGRVSRKLRASARELAALPEDLPESPAPEADFDTRAVLDDEVARLPERYQLVVQACYIAGHTTAEAAARLGWAKGTVLTRLAWARKRLRARLSARGVSLSVGAFGTLLGRPAAMALGWPLIESTTRAALAVVAGEAAAGAVSDRPFTLSEGVIRAMALDKLKWVGGAVLVVAVLAGVGVGRWTAEAQGEPGGQAKNAKKGATLPPPTDPLVPPQTNSRDPLVGEPTRLPPPATTRDVPFTPPSENAPRLSPDPIRENNIPPMGVPSIPSSNVPAPVVGKTFVVSRPIGTWTREMAGGNETYRVVAKFDEDHLTIQVTISAGRESVDYFIDADYSITRDSLVFGVITGFDMTATDANGPGQEKVTDQTFSFRYRVDNGVLSLKDFNAPFLGEAGKESAMFAGRYTAADDLPAAPAKPRAKPVAPRRSTSSSSIPPQALPTGTGPYIGPPPAPGIPFVN